jgi:signal transduction histidine kinase
LFSKYFNKLSALCDERVMEHGAQYELFGIFAVINYIVPYFMWSPSSNSNYALLICLRLLAGCLCFLLIIKDYWHEALLPYLPLYWHITLLYCLPFLTTFMLFDSQCSTFWLLNMILALFLLAVLVDSHSFVAILILGVLLGYGLFVVTGHTELFSLSADTIYWTSYMCLYSVMVGILFSRRNEKIAQERLGAYKSVSASIAHEMRTPLSAMYISAQGVQEYLPQLLKTYDIAKKNNLDIPKLDHKKLQILQDIPNHFISISRRSLSIIDIFLTKFGNFEKQVLPMKQCFLSECIQKAIDEYPFYPKTESKLITVAPEGDFSCFGNESLLVHIFSNLIKNSLFQIQTARKGHIKIWYSSMDHFNIVHFYDDASGIKSQDLPKIFDKFYTSKEDGTGIGLSYCKQAMNAFGGRIVCNTIYGEYTEFQLFFPKV